ncbi:AAA family ATPase [Marimonas arenosa]|uniref:Helicase RepA family protein n=1 Tax=Marimonas arenosa TaxID=1795305 RepID=A0AAE3WER2_9RHOB|nr:AAA family ATPase [Marimonas arenosa]MDQ2091344.1 helicase RepA family protein [Marimonas arenosa]
MKWAEGLKAAANGVAACPLPDGVTMPATISAQELETKDFPPISWVVEGLIPEGLTLLAGKPKIGKSWLALQIGLAVSTSGEVLGRRTTQGTVLYAALEDNPRRLKSRMSKSCRCASGWPRELIFATEWPRLDAGGLEATEAWIGQHPNTRLVIIDTLATVRPASNSRDSLYQSDYQALRGLHDLANRHGVGIVVIHHVRKAEAEDRFDTVSGSTGLTGAADATLVLSNTSDGKVLYGRGRDLAEFESAVEFDQETCRWSDLGRPCDAYGSATRKAIREALTAGKNSPKDIAEHCGLDYDLCAKTLQRMAEGGEVLKGGRDNYRLTPDPLP